MKAFNHTLHKELWDWLARTGSDDKTEWFDINAISTHAIPDSYCYACEYSDRCADCPFDVDNSKECLDGLYACWVCEEDVTERKQIAGQIRDLPVKEGIKVV